MRNERPPTKIPKKMDYMEELMRKKPKQCLECGKSFKRAALKDKLYVCPYCGNGDWMPL
jgi:ribosomal protein L37AE/L43A